MKKEAYVAVAAEGAGDGVLSSDSDVMQGVFMRPSATSVCGLKLLVYEALHPDSDILVPGCILLHSR